MADVKNVGELEQKDCCGCSICASLCPVEAIDFHDDALNGFTYPKVDSDKCINCRKCINKCPQNNPVRRVNVLSKSQAKVFAAWSSDDSVRLLCTSGGIFYELGRKVIQNKGVVIACSYTDDFRGAYHKAAFTEAELIPLCGSKYVQSSTQGIFSQVKSYLADYPLVMFAGTPCQVAGLYAFLGCEHENLITVDFICNSINSPKAQAKYIDSLEEIYGSRLIYARSKDKRYGWNNFGSSAKFADGQEYYASRNQDSRVISYHHGHLFIRTSCLDCKYKVLPRNSDITLADFWGIERDERNPKLELGTSAVIANSQIGLDFFESLDPERVFYYEKTLDDVIRGNGNLIRNVTMSSKSVKAFKALDHVRFDIVVNKYRTRPALKARIKYIAKKILSRLLRIRRR